MNVVEMICCQDSGVTKETSENERRRKGETLVGQGTDIDEKVGDESIVLVNRLKTC